MGASGPGPGLRRKDREVKAEHLKQLARLAVETQDHALMIRALELLSELEPEEVKTEPAVKPEPVSTRAIAVRNLLAAWRPYQVGSAKSGLQTTQLERQVISRLSDEDIKHLFPLYRRDDAGAERGWAIEDGIPNINIGLHTDKVVCTHGNGRRFFLKRIM